MKDTHKIIQYLRRHGPATTRDIRAALNLSSQSINGMIAGLCKRGTLTQSGRTDSHENFYAIADRDPDNPYNLTVDDVSILLDCMPIAALSHMRTGAIPSIVQNGIRLTTLDAATKFARLEKSGRRECKKCGKIKPIEKFPRSRKNGDGRYHTCHTCICPAGKRCKNCGKTFQHNQILDGQCAQCRRNTPLITEPTAVMIFEQALRRTA